MKLKISALWRLSTLVLLLTACQKPSPESSPIKNEDSEPGANPGYYDEWVLVKQDENGEIPPLPYDELKAWDEAHRFNKDAPDPVLTQVIEMGPSNVGGRTRGLLIDADYPERLYAGGVSGGVWISTNEGSSWNQVDDAAKAINVTDIIQDPVNRDILYYCTGESIGQKASRGAGVFRSMDRGASFSQLPSTVSAMFLECRSMEASLNQPGVFYLGTFRNGLYKATANGDTMTQVLTQGAVTDVTDIEYTDDGFVVAAVRSKGVFYSPNGNSGSFTEANGLPADTVFGQIKLAYTPADGGVLYCLLEDTLNRSQKDTLPLIVAAYQHIYKSTDNGMNWSPVNDPFFMRFYQDSYNLMIGVSQTDADKIIVGATQLGFTSNGGVTWLPAQLGHADHHAFYPHPTKPDSFLIGNDGGVYQYQWSNAQFAVSDINNGYNVTQFYAGDHFPVGSSYIGGTQDNGTPRVLNGITSSTNITCCDGAFCWVSQSNPDFGYTSTQEGILHRRTGLTGPNPGSTTIVSNLDGPDADSRPDEGSWFITRFYMNRSVDQQLYYLTREGVWLSQNAGNSWGKITDTIPNPYALTMENNPNPTVYVGGLGNGGFYRIDNPTSGSPVVTDLRATVWPTVTTRVIHGLEIHPQDKSIVYACVSNLGSPHTIFRITNATDSLPVWNLIDGDLPSQLPVNYVIPDPLRPDSVIFAATDFGLYFTEDGGQHWNKEFRVPNCPIYQLKIRPGDRKLFMFTHGRGVFTANLLEPGEAYADLPYAYSFDSPSGPHWSFSSSTMEGEVIQTVEHSPQDGPMCLGMQVLKNQVFNTNRADLRLNLRDYSDVSLKFYWKHFNDENHPEDGLFASADGGETFTKIWTLLPQSFPANTWRQEVLNLDDLVEAAGVPYSETFVLRFQQRDNYRIPSDGVAWDQIEIEGKAYATIPYFTGFSNSSLDPYWSIGSNSRSGRAELSSANLPLNGNYLALDRSVSGGYSSSWGDLHLDLEGTQLPRLLFWWKHFSDEPHPEDGIFFSDDGGETFKKVWSFPLSTQAANTWVLEDLDVNLLANSNALSKSRRFVIRFQQHDNYPIISDGIAIDNVELRGLYHAVPPYATGFDMEGFDKFWQTKSSRVEGRVEVTQANGPLHGGFHAVMDVNTNSILNTNELKLGLNLSGKCNVQLAYAMKDFGDETHPEDGIYLSSNSGATWVKVKDFNVAPAQHNIWQLDTLNLSALAGQNGLWAGPWFAVKFQQRDNFSVPMDGFAIDDVVVTASNCKGNSEPLKEEIPLSAKLFPNPASDEVSFQFSREIENGEGWCRIYNLQGHLMDTQALSHWGNASSKVSLRGLASGTYFLHIETGEYSGRHKLILQR